MRIMYVSDTLALWGGIERVVSCKANELAERYGYEIRFVTTNQGGHEIPFQLHERVSHVDLDVRFHLQYQYRLARRFMVRRQMQALFVERLRAEVNTYRPDVVVIITPDLVHGVLKACKGVPLAFESHSSYYSDRFDKNGWRTRLKSYFVHRAMRHVQMIVALTEADAENWRKVNPHVTVIPNIVHLNETGAFSDCLPRKAIFAGRFTKQKGIGDLLRVWQRVYDRHPDWQLDIYGDGELKEFYQSEIDRMNIHIQVHCPDADILQRYRESSVLLMTSVYEPFGLVLPEAMSCGIPVVAFDCPYGPSQIITDGKDGFLVPGRDIQLYADSVCQLIESQELRKKMGAAGVVSSHRFTSDAIMPQWKRLFENLAS